MTEQRPANPSSDESHSVELSSRLAPSVHRELTPPPVEQGRKDVVSLRSGEQVQVFLRFRDFLGQYPMHCHNIVHEDHAMMLRWDVIPR